MKAPQQPAGVELALTDKQAIDRVCLEFEDLWRCGESPQLEDFLQGFEGRARSVLLGELLLVELAYVRARGEQPERARYAKRFPSDAQALTAAFGPVTEDRVPTYRHGTQIGPYRIQKLLAVKFNRATEYLNIAYITICMTVSEMKTASLFLLRALHFIKYLLFCKRINIGNLLTRNVFIAPSIVVDGRRVGI